MVNKKNAYVSQAQQLMTYAFGEAISSGHDFIKKTDLFSALAKMNDEVLDGLFTLFSMESGDLARALMFSSLSTRGSWVQTFARRDRWVWF